MNAAASEDAEYPLVTLGLPTFNGQRTIRRALDAIVAQSYPNLEVIICDDVSSDRTAQICEAYAKRHAHFSFEVNQQNLGDCGVGNIAKIAGMAQGKFFVWMCQDDVWDVDFVSNLLTALTGTADAVAAMPACEFFWINGKERLSDTYRISKGYWPQSASLSDNFCRILRRAQEVENGRMIRLSFVLHGLVKTGLFQHSLELFNRPMEPERHLVALWALTGKLVYVDEELYLKEAPELLVAMTDNAMTDNARAESSQFAEMRGSKHKANSKFRFSFIRSTIGFLKAVWKLNGLSRWERFVGSMLFLRYAIDRGPVPVPVKPEKL